MSTESIITMLTAAFTLGSNMAYLRSRLNNLTKSFHDFKNDTGKRFTSIEARLDELKAPSNGVHSVDHGP